MSDPSTFLIGGELPVHRLGFGAMRLPGIRGPLIEGEDDLADFAPAREVLREAVRLGVDFIDTAQIYGHSELMIADAMHPYPEGLVIATKGGLKPGGIPDGRPEFLRAGCEASLRRLRVERIDLWQLHRIDPEVPIEEQFGVIRELQDEGKIRFAGVSEVTVDELARARELIDVATVQNRFNQNEQWATDVLEVCEADGIGFMPWAPMGMGALPARESLEWLMLRSPVILPIPGTSSIEHLRSNMEAAAVSAPAAS